MALFKRKDKDTKKGAENTIGKIIYGFLLFMPLLSIGVRCLYVIFNKNAYQSYSDNYITSTTKVTSSNQLVDGGNYVFNVATYKENWVANTYIIAERLYLKDSNINFSTYFAESVVANINSVTFQTQNVANQLRVRVYDANNNEIGHIYNSNHWDIFNENTYMTISSFTNPRANQYGLTLLTYKEDKLDNVFEYSINQTQQSNLYNWASNTGTYTVLQTTCTQLGINNTFIPLLFAYWLITSVIYFIFDIALILIWLVHNKIHELQESV